MNLREDFGVEGYYATGESLLFLLYSPISDPPDAFRSQYFIAGLIYVMFRQRTYLNILRNSVTQNHFLRRKLPSLNIMRTVIISGH